MKKIVLLALSILLCCNISFAQRNILSKEREKAVKAGAESLSRAITAEGWKTKNALSLKEQSLNYYQNISFTRIYQRHFFEGDNYDELIRSATELLNLKAALMCCAISDSNAFKAISVLFQGENMQEFRVSDNTVYYKSGTEDDTSICSSNVEFQKDKGIVEILNTNKFKENDSENSMSQFYYYFIPETVMQNINNMSGKVLDMYKETNSKTKSITLAIEMGFDTLIMRDIFNQCSKEIDDYNNNYASFSHYAEPIVNSTINKWQEKGEFETSEQYYKRVNESTREAKANGLIEKLKGEYKSAMTRSLYSDISLIGKYDADNETFHIKWIALDSEFTHNILSRKAINRYIAAQNKKEINQYFSYMNTILTDKELTCIHSNLKRTFSQEMVVHVPRNEATAFRQNFSKMAKFPKFVVANDKLTLSELELKYRDKTYKYSNEASLSYSNTMIAANFDPINIPVKHEKPKENQVITENRIIVGKSDIDINIPKTDIVNDRTFALIIANEDYNYVKDVPFATNDGRTFKDYCNLTLGIPEDHIRYINNATLGDLINHIGWITQISKAHKGNAAIIVYYAGHGIPDESSKDAYILPVDGNGSNTRISYKLGELYTALSTCNAKTATVFLDACFSGAERSGDMVNSARAVSVSAKKETPNGNVIVFSAAQGDQTAYPYKEQEHGLFTYYLLKKIQQSKGNVTLGDLSDYVIDNVTRESLIKNNKGQTPSIIPSVSYSNNWREVKLAN